VAFWGAFEPSREAARALARALEARSPLELAELGAAAAEASGAATWAGARFWGHGLQRAALAGLAAAAAPGGPAAAEALDPERVAGLVAESAAAFRQDREHVASGVYREPYDQAGPRAGALWAARSAQGFLRDAGAALLAPSAFAPLAAFAPPPGGAGAPPGGRPPGGVEDVVRRQPLVPLSEFVCEQVELRGRARGLRLLDLGSGGGRTGCLAKDNWPELAVTCADRSPADLRLARQSALEWHWLRSGGGGGGGPGAPLAARGGAAAPRPPGDPPGFDFVLADARGLPFPDGHFDAVVSVDLLGGLPGGAARREAAAEMFRVLRPGGLAVVTDALQPGDRPALDASRGPAPAPDALESPDYAGEDLGALFAAAGFACARKELCAAHKTLSFRRPPARRAPAPPAAPPADATASR